MSKNQKPKMATSWEIYNRILWDYRLDKNIFIAGFEDRVSESGVREKPLAHWAADGDIPWHRIHYIRCKDIVVWDREQHLDLISSDNLPSFAWKSEQVDENVLTSSDKSEINTKEEDWILDGDLENNRNLISDEDGELNPYLEIITPIFNPIPVYKYDNQGWQPVEDLSNSLKSINYSSLKIVSFNVLHNLFDRDKIQTQKRLPAIVEELRKCDADIIAIQEAIPDLLKLLLTQNWVKDYYISDSINADTIQPFGHLLLSRLPFSIVEDEFSKYKKYLVGSWFVNSELLQVAAVHLTSNRAQNADEKRKYQLTTLINHLQKQSRNYLIVGDFNTRNNLPAEIPDIDNLIDIWQELRPDEPGYTFDPQRNPLAEFMSLQGEPARFDRILLNSHNSNWIPESVELFATEPVRNTQGNIFPSDHFGIQAVIQVQQQKPTGQLLQQNTNYSSEIPLSLSKRGERGEVTFELENKEQKLKEISPVYRSAIAIIPPPDVLPPIQAIRKVYDARFERWMAHINLIYGFLPESYFDEAAKIISSAVAQVKPFTITLNNFETFTHRQSSTAWLRPITEPENILQELQALLQSLFPQCNEQSRKSDAGFTPHLSVGQFSTPEVAFAKLPQWYPQSFTVKSIALISRRGDEPFEIRRIINLGEKVGEQETISTSSKLVHLVNKIEPTLNQSQQIERDTVLEIITQACQECLGFPPNINLLGSYRLGVQSPESDLDVVCQIPSYLSGENFLKNVQQHLEGLCESIQLVLDAKVPLLRLKLEGISLDLLYAAVDENWELGNKSSLINLEKQEDIKAIIGCWEADLITEFVREYVPFNSFCLLLRAVRGWAKQRGIYGNSWGFLGGFSWALLSAWSCQYCDKNHTNPDNLLNNFFHFLNQHDWNQPIALTDAGKEYSIQLPRDLLPIITSIQPCQNSARNITRSTSEILRREIKRGAELTQEIMAGNLDWNSLFESSDLKIESDIFLVLTVKSNDNQELEKTCGNLEAYIISLIIQLENNDIFVRPWNRVEKTENLARIILGLKLPLNYDFSLIEELAQDFVSQFCNQFEVKILESL